ncbi:hypothetical protein ABMA27_011346 [Loxostege sticticalis]|uniref:UDENN domain-containing protein n=1 Tax=Loxostege sticticalis TaxID=481309 RepID=A0ABR3H281_LOXSC
MISQTKNRVQAIKSKFENLSSDNENLIVRKSEKHLCKQDQLVSEVFAQVIELNNSENENDSNTVEVESPEPNSSYLYSKIDPKKAVSDVKKSLIRQCSDPGKKLHRSHAFRCDRSQKITNSPKRHGSCNGRSETSDFTLKMGEKKLSKDRLKRLGNLLEDQMRKENFVVPSGPVIVGEILEVKPTDSIPDKDVPKHILDQYAKVVKPKKNEDKQDTMTDSGVSSETENLEDDKSSKIKKLSSHFEKTETATNLEGMNDLCVSSDTIRLERKNPHLTLTDTLKKALKQPLPAGPPPKKPPRTFVNIPENEKQKKDTKKMLEKLEQVLQKREAQNTSTKNIYDIAESNMSAKKPKEVHYLCTEILDITHRTLLPNQNTSESLANCFNSLNCAVLTNSTASLPYSRLSSNFEHLNGFCSCSNNSLDEIKHMSTFGVQNKCSKCMVNDEKEEQFKCHLNCECKEGKSEFYVEKEHIYDEPFNEEASKDNGTVKRNHYGTINSLKMNGSYSKSLEDLRMDSEDDKKIYDIPCDVSRSETPDFTTSSPKSEFQKLRENFENGFCPDTPKPEPENRKSSTPSLIRKFSTEITEPGLIRKFSTEYTEPASDIRKPSNESNEIVSANIRKFSSNLKDIPEAKKSDDTDTKKSTEKPALLTKPNFVKKVSKSSENLTEEFKSAKRLVEKKFGTEAKRYRNRAEVGNTVFSLPKKNCTQLDVDRENLNRLMNEIYETVTAACNMDDRKPCSFPTDQSDGSTSEDSIKLTRSLTEKRKNYVRRVSSRVAYLDQNNIRRTRYRHQTSVCSYKSEIIDNPYSTFRSWKSFRTSRSNLNDSKMETDSKFNLTDSTGNILSMKDEFDSESIDKFSIDEKTGCVDIGLPFEPRERGLFNVCLLVGLNYMTGEAYVKSVFPNQVQVPPHIENLIFPETLSSASRGEWAAEAKGAQCYSLVLTDERGERSYGYCRRVLPEGASTCLPLCYCLIGRYRAPGFYYKVLQEIESHHGSSEVEIHSILQQLFETDFPNPGEELTITYKHRIESDICSSGKSYRNSINLGDILKCKTMPDMRRSGGNESSNESSKELTDGLKELADGSKELSDGSKELANCLDSAEGRDYSDLPKFLDLENNNGPKKVLLSLENPKTRVIKRPIEPRVDEDNLSTLLDSLGAGLVIKVFGSLLLERKLVICSDQLSAVSSCMEALQSALYPFVWQQPLIAAIPAEIQRDVLEAPLPILAGMLKTTSVDYSGVNFEEGMLIDLTHPSKAIFYQGDESTILPTASYKTLKTSLQMETNKQTNRQDTKTRNVMISEAFLRFFVDILGDFWRFFSFGELKDGELGKGNVVFDKEAYIKSVSSKQNQYFLEWFTETAMFNHFIQNMAVSIRLPTSPTTPPSPTLPISLQFEFADSKLVDTPLPSFYELFNERLWRNRNVNKSVDKTNYKSAVNKKVKLLKTKLRDLIT